MLAARVFPADVEVPAADDGAFRSLQEAVDACAPDAVITVAPGEYLGPVRLHVPGLTLRGADGEKPTIIGFDDFHVLRVEARCTLRALSLVHKTELPGAALEVTAAAEDVVVEDCVVAASFRAVSLRGPRAMVRGCRLHGGCTAGVEVRAPGASIENCEIYSFLKAGVDVVGAAASIKDNVLRDSEIGAYFAHGEGTFTDNIVLQCKFGVWLAHHADPTVSDCFFRRCRVAAFFADEAAGRFLENRVEGLGGDGQDSTGVLATGDADPEVSDNDFAVCEFGLHIREFAKGRYCRNRIHDCATGVFATRSAVPLLAANEIFACRDIEAGIVVAEGARGVLSGNHVHSNRGNGIVVKKAAEPLLRGNKVRGNERSGVVVHTGATPALENNFVEENAFHGVQVFMEGMALLESNRIAESGHHGVYVHTGGAASLTANVITGCGGAAVAAANLGVVQVDRLTVAEETNRRGMGEGFAVFDTGGIDWK